MDRVPVDEYYKKRVKRLIAHEKSDKTVKCKSTSE